MHLRIRCSGAIGQPENLMTRARSSKRGYWATARGTTLFGHVGTAGGGSLNVKQALAPLQLLKGTAAANAALAGATVIEVAFAIIQSVAMDQFIAIISARPKLEASLAQAQQPITLEQLLNQPNGSDE